MSYVIGFGLSDLESAVRSASAQGQNVIRNLTPGGKPAVASNAQLPPDNANFAADLFASPPPADPAHGSLLDPNGYRLYNAYLALSPLRGTDAKNFNDVRLARAGVPPSQTPNLTAMKPAEKQDVIQRAQANLSMVGPPQFPQIPGGPSPYGAPYSPGMSTGAKVAIGAGVVWVVGLGYWIATKK